MARLDLGQGSLEMKEVEDDVAAYTFLL